MLCQTCYSFVLERDSIFGTRMLYVHPHPLHRSTCLFQIVCALKIPFPVKICQSIHEFRWRISLFIYCALILFFSQWCCYLVRVIPLPLLFLSDFDQIFVLLIWWIVRTTSTFLFDTCLLLRILYNWPSFAPNENSIHPRFIRGVYGMASFFGEIVWMRGVFSSYKNGA